MENTASPLLNPFNHTQYAEPDSMTHTRLPGSLSLSDLWRSTLENQACFISNCADDMLVQLARNRLLMANQLKQISAHSERMITLMAHTACRALAIATQARKKDCDRRVFSLPLPGERRVESLMDRRKCLSGNNHL